MRAHTRSHMRALTHARTHTHTARTEFVRHTIFCGSHSIHVSHSCKLRAEKYNVQPVFVAVFTVNELGGLLDLMATSPE